MWYFFFFFYSFYRHSTTKERRRKITCDCRNSSFFRELSSSTDWSRKIRNLTVHDKMPRNLDWNHWKDNPFMCNCLSAQLSKICFFLHNNILTNVLYDIWMQYMLSIAGICYKAFQSTGSNKNSNKKGSHTSVQGLKEDLDSGGTLRLM